MGKGRHVLSPPQFIVARSAKSAPVLSLETTQLGGPSNLQTGHRINPLSYASLGELVTKRLKRNAQAL